MYKEARQISADRKIDRKATAAKRWADLKLRAVRTEVKQPNGSTSDHQPTSNNQVQSGNTNSPSPHNRQPTVKKYLDRITIAGLHNYLYATERYEKITWRLTFLVAIVGTLFYLVTTIQTYLEFTIVLDIQHKTEPALRLPHVWVCIDTLNRTYISELSERARPKLIFDRRVRVLADRFRQRNKPAGSFYTQWNSTSMASETIASIWNPNTTSWEYRTEYVIDTFMVWTEGFSITSPYNDGFASYSDRAHLVEDILYRIGSTYGPHLPGYKAFYEDGMFSCESVVKSCALSGVPFDCCASGSMGYSTPPNRCFRLNINQTATDRNLQQSSSSSITLTFETIIDSQFSGESIANQANGITVTFGNRMPTVFEMIQPVAPGTITTITVNGKKKVEVTNCTNAYKFDPRLHVNSHPLLISYFKDMADPRKYSVGTCEMGKFLDAIYQQCGCVLYYDTIRPQNDSDICTATHMYACLYRAFHDVSPNNKPDTGASTSAASGSVSVEDEMKRATMHQLKLASAAECLPLCETWKYNFRDSSMPAEGSAANISRYYRNKVDIIFDPEYRVETEVYKMDYSTLIASLGDGFGLILGFSAVTLIQLPVWAVAAIVLRRKLRKVSPLSRQAAIHNRLTSVV